jgi:hypothetical protein
MCGAGQRDAHVAAWRMRQHYVATPLSDGTTMYLSKAALAEADPQALTDAIQRRHAARWKKKKS